VNSWIKTAVLLLVIWALAAGIVGLARSSRPDPARLTAFLAANPASALNGPERERVMERVISDLNRLNFEQRRQLQRSPELREFFESLPPGEKEVFIERTLPEGFRQMMIAFNEMEPERRKRLVERALADIEQAREDGRMNGPAPEVDAAVTRKIIDEGLQAFYSEASAEVKLDLAPVIERIQESLQTMR
jgi:DNA invertase Pin-like site-specific DNA recombinase